MGEKNLNFSKFIFVQIPEIFHNKSNIFCETKLKYLLFTYLCVYFMTFFYICIYHYTLFSNFYFLHIDCHEHTLQV